MDFETRKTTSSKFKKILLRFKMQFSEVHLFAVNSDRVAHLIHAISGVQNAPRAAQSAISLGIVSLISVNCTRGEFHGENQA